jgi:hypothetical protein
MRSRIHVTASRILLGFALIVIPGGCTRDDAPTPAGQASSDLLVTVQDLLQRARKAGAGNTGSGELAELQKSIEKAKAASEQGKEVAAKSQDRPRPLNDLIAEQKKNTDAVKALVADKAAAEDARKKADAERPRNTRPSLRPGGGIVWRAKSWRQGSWTEVYRPLFLLSAVNQYDQATLSRKQQRSRDRAEGERRRCSPRRRGPGRTAPRARCARLAPRRAKRARRGHADEGRIRPGQRTYRQATDQYQRPSRRPG